MTTTLRRYIRGFYGTGFTGLEGSVPPTPEASMVSLGGALEDPITAAAKAAAVSGGHVCSSWALAEASPTANSGYQCYLTNLMFMYV